MKIARQWQVRDHFEVVERLTGAGREASAKSLLGAVLSGADSAGRSAAAAPVCGGGDPDWAKRYVGLPVWAFHGDGVPSVLEVVARVKIASRIERTAETELVDRDQAHDDRNVFQASPDELPVIDIHSV